MKNDKKKVILIIIGLVAIVLITIGVSYSIFSYEKLGDTINSVQVGALEFRYRENTGVGRGITMSNAFPVSDEEGKNYAEEGQVFDFSIEGKNTGNTPIPYEITLDKKSSSTLDSDVVKVYLTDITSEEEVSLLEPSFFSDLSDIVKVGSKKEKKIYSDSVLGNTSSYLKKFRLRMWIDEKTDYSGIFQEDGTMVYPYNNKSFVVLVNVYADNTDSEQEETNTVTLTYNGITRNQTVTDNKVSFSNVKITDSNKAIKCNNGVVPSYDDNVLTLTNLTTDSTCEVVNSFTEALTINDSSLNNVVMLNDVEEEITSRIALSNKNVNLDLNGNLVNINANYLSGGTTITVLGGTITIDDNKGSGGMILDTTDSTNKCIALISIGGGVSPVINVKSGYYSSNAATGCSIIQGGGGTSTSGTINIDGKEANSCTSNINDYKTGLCIYSDTTEALKNNGASYNQFNIYGGTFVSNSQHGAYLTDAPGGETNIYGGHFKSGAFSVKNVGSTTVNVCGGNFDSPTDLYLNNENGFIKYKSTGITWYNNNSTPTLGGTHQENITVDDTLTCSR